MSTAVAHRGPDDAGHAVLPQHRLYLAHRRLSILDLTSAGHQPMVNPQGWLWICFNGEIYNFHELRQELEREGVRFHSASDTEVLLLGIERYGIEYVRRLNGIFAFALANLRQRKLWLVRDQFGVKPLYFCTPAGGGLLFGSEIKAILASGAYVPELDTQACCDYFTYLCAPQATTMYAGIRQVPPAHWLEWDFDSGLGTPQRYWRVDAGEMWGAGATASAGQQAETVYELLSASVKRQMVSDVRVGLFLSGGLDSGILALLMAEHSSQPIETFTVGFREPGADYYDEGGAAALMAGYVGAHHHHCEVRLDNPWDLLRQGQWFDQPFGNETAYLLHQVAVTARGAVKVALCGAGGDELFAGYHRYRALYATRRLRRALPSKLLRRTPAVTTWLVDNHRHPGLRRVREFFAGLDRDPVRQFMNWSYYLNEQETRQLLSPWIRGNVPLAAADRWVRRLAAESRAGADSRWLHIDLECFLVDNILEYTDKATMAVALETRTPFLDPSLASYAISLPFERQVHAGGGKRVLRRAFAKRLPSAILAGAKRGFNAPLGMWMSGPLDAYFDRHMRQEQVRDAGVFDWGYLQLLRQEHRAGLQDHAAVLFSIISFDLWFRRIFRGEAVWDTMPGTLQGVAVKEVTTSACAS